MGISVYLDDGVPDPKDVGSDRVASTETCLFWRAARDVLNEGHPACENVLIRVPGTRGEAYPLLIMTTTKAERLICWLALPERVCEPEEEHRLHLIDHVTLDLRSRRSHSSAYKPGGGKLPTARKWTLHKFSGNDVSLWFGFAVRRCVLERQLLKREQWIRFPSTDAERRKEEYVRFFEKLRFIDANLPAQDQSPGDALCGFVYVVDGPNVTLSDELVPPFIDSDFVEAFGESIACPVQSTGLVVGSVQLGMLMGFLPGKLRENGPFCITPGRG